MNLLTLLLYAALGGSLFFLPFCLIQVHGYSATQAGAAFLPMSAIMFAGSRWAGGLVARYGARRPLLIGPCVAAGGYAGLALLGHESHYWSGFFPGIVVVATGMMLTVAPLTSTVLGAVDQRYAGLASGLNSAVSRTASLLAIAVLGIVAVSVFNAQLDRRLDALQVPAHIRHQLDAERAKLAAAQAPAGPDEQLRSALEGAIDDSFVTSFQWLMAIAAGLALLSAGSAWWMIEDDRIARTFLVCDSAQPRSFTPSKPRANRSASRTARKTGGVTVPTNARKPAFGTVATLSRLIAERVFSPLSGPTTTSDGMPRIVVVSGATVTV